RNPKPKFNATKEVSMALTAVQETGGKFGMSYVINVLRGSANQQIKYMGHDTVSVYGQGVDLDEKQWKSIFTQLIVHDLLFKDIDDYGVIKLTKAGRNFLSSPYPIELIKFIEMDKIEKDIQVDEDFKAYDEILFDKLKRLRKEIATQKKIPPYVIFQDPSLEEMAAKYPITLAEFENIVGVGAGKARKFAQPFMELIKKYVEENEIERSEELVIKTSGKNSSIKLFIITQIDRKTPLEEIAEMKDITFEELLSNIEQIVYSGTKLNLDYYIREAIDEDKLEELYDYFKKSETDCIDTAQRIMGSDYTREEIQLVRIKFYSEVAN
ncbi:MAG: RQC domain-containing protein, partial [Bacteroidia bacterium]|nr:RQC domain-containing protein [Bacteroidia bacterium]